MKIKYKKSFEKDLEKLPQKIILQIFGIISLIENSERLHKIKQIKKLSWHKNIFRIKIWEYRLWFRQEENEIILERFLHRKDIYKFFPK